MAAYTSGVNQNIRKTINKRSVGRVIVLVFACIGVGSLASRILRPWTLPSGGGQYEASPDGRYEFSAWNLADDAPWGRDYLYYKFEIKNLGTGEIIRTICIPEPEPDAPIFSNPRRPQ